MCLEMKIGSLPCYYTECESNAELYERIYKADFEKLTKGYQLTPQFEAFLQRCLVADWKQRACCNELITHRFFFDTD